MTIDFDYIEYQILLNKLKIYNWGNVISLFKTNDHKCRK